MDLETQAVLFDAVPLLIVAALSVTVGAATAYLLLRDRVRPVGPDDDRGRRPMSSGLSERLLDAS